MNSDAQTKRHEFLWRVLHAFERYYDIKHTDDVTPPFTAEAEFHSHDERYVLVRTAKVAEIDSHEFVFFAETDNLTGEQLAKFDEAAWNAGISRVRPTFIHRNSDVTLVILADVIEKSVLKQIKKLKHYKSYCFSFKGWSEYRVLAFEISSGKVVYNRIAHNLKNLVGNIN